MNLFSLSKKCMPLFLTVVIGYYTAYGQSPNFPMNPEGAELIKTDLENFVEAFEMLKTNKDTLEVLNTVYFGRASTGLKEFVSKHQLTATLLKNAIKEHPEKYHGISDFISRLAKIKEEYLNVLLEYGKLVPNTMYAPTYLLVGANRGIAQASQYGQLVTVTKLMDNTEQLITFIVHELSHFQQAKELGGQQYVAVYSKPNNMLDLCLREGGAEFITHLTLGRTTQAKATKYLLENEDDLKQKFETDLKSQNSKYWLWESLNQKEHPKLLGYAMGYRICKHFYELQDDKNEAVRQILAIKDPQQFLQASNYFQNK